MVPNKLQDNEITGFVNRNSFQKQELAPSSFHSELKRLSNFHFPNFLSKMENENRGDLHELIKELTFANGMAEKLIQILTDATNDDEEALRLPIESVFRDLIGNQEEMKKILFDFCKLADLDLDIDQDRGGAVDTDRYKETSSRSSSKKKKLSLEEELDSKLKIESSAESSSKKVMKIEKNEQTDEEIDIESLEQQGGEEQEVIADQESKKSGKDNLRVMK